MNMTQETITLTTGEVLEVERTASENNSAWYEVHIMQKDLALGPEVVIFKDSFRALSDGQRRWCDCDVTTHRNSTNTLYTQRKIEILQHAARLASELDRQYPAGIEVSE
jgi:hypothetical protein